MRKPNTKEIITSGIIDQLVLMGSGGGWTYTQAMLKWWVNIRKDGGLRLTAVGDKMLRTVDVEHYSFPLDLPKVDSLSKTKEVTHWNGALLELDNKMPCPYYLGRSLDTNDKGPVIRLYDGKTAMLIELYGDVFAYLKSIRVTK